MTPARVLLVDDHQIMRDGLRLLLRDRPEVEVVGDASDTEAAWLAVENLKPDVVILDLELPGVGGMALARRLQQHFPEIKVIILTGHTEPQFVSKALHAGVQGYVAKTNASSLLVTALRAVLGGHVYLCPEASTHVVREYRRQADAGEGSVHVLSARELETLKRIAEGQSTKEIAFALSVSTKTVETHRLNILAKLHLKSVADLTKYAVREGLTTL